MPITVNSSINQDRFFEAANIFVDRNEPRATFWKTYETYCKMHSQQPNYAQVLAYYGMGGVGKTALLKKIASEMDEKLEGKARYVRFDFNDSQNPLEILARIKNILENEYKFDFPLFELGQYALAQKNGQDMEAPEAKSFFEKSPSLGTILDVVGILPAADLCIKLAKAVDTGISLISNLVQKHKTSTLTINTLGPQDLQDYLPQLFISDLNDNIENKDKPLVIFLDTYEQLVNETKDGNAIHYADEWLKGREGLISHCSNVLWVIAGRERLKWMDLNPNWEGTLIQQSLGQFSELDSIDYLQKSGIKEDTLRKQLSKLTSGVPIHLSLCVDVYNRIKDSNGTPTIADFGESFEGLIPLFMKRLENESERLQVFLLSCLQMWDDALVQYVSKDVLKGLWETSYSRVKGLSFITDTQDGKYNMHQTACTAIRKSPGVEYQLIREKIKQKSIEYATAKIRSLPVYDPEYGFWLLWLTKFIVANSVTAESAEKLFAEFVYPYWKKIPDMGFFDLASSILDALQYNDLYQGNSWHLANIFSLRAQALEKKDEIQADKMGHVATEMYSAHPKSKYTKFDLAVLDFLTYFMYGKPEEFYLQKISLDIYCNLFGLDDDQVREKMQYISMLCMEGIAEGVSQEEKKELDEKINILKKESNRIRKDKILLKLQEQKKSDGFLDTDAIDLIYELSTVVEDKEESSKIRAKCLSLAEKILKNEKSIDNYNTLAKACSAYTILEKCHLRSNYKSTEEKYLQFLTTQANELLESSPSEDVIKRLQLCDKEITALLFGKSPISDKILQRCIDFYGENGEETISFADKILEKNRKIDLDAYYKCIDIKVGALKKKLKSMRDASKVLRLPMISVVEEICNLTWKKAIKQLKAPYDKKNIYNKLGEEGISLNELLLKLRLAFYGTHLENRNVLRQLAWLYEGKGNTVKAQEYQSMLEETVISFFKKRWEMRRDISGESHPETLGYLHGLAFNLSVLKKYKESLETYDKLIELAQNLPASEKNKALNEYYSKPGLFDVIERMVREQMDPKTIDSLLQKYVVQKNFVPSLENFDSLATTFQESQFHSSIPHLDEALKIMQEFNSAAKKWFSGNPQIIVQKMTSDYDAIVNELEALLASARKFFDKSFFGFMNPSFCWLLGKLCLTYMVNDQDDKAAACAKEFCSQRNHTDYHEPVLEFIAYVALLDDYDRLGNKEEKLKYANLLLELLQNPDKSLLSDMLFQFLKIQTGNELTQTFLDTHQYEKSLDCANLVIKMIQEQGNVDPEQKDRAEQLLKTVKSL